MDKNKPSIDLAIVGSRGFSNYDMLKQKINGYICSEYNISKIISGGANGADKLGERFADEFGIEKQILYADWKQFGKKAGYLRNVDIVNACDIIIAFWDGISKGTKHSIDLAKANNKKLIIIDTNEQTLDQNEISFLKNKIKTHINE